MTSPRAGGAVDFGARPGRGAAGGHRWWRGLLAFAVAAVIFCAAGEARGETTPRKIPLRVGHFADTRLLFTADGENRPPNGDASAAFTGDDGQLRAIDIFETSSSTTARGIIFENGAAGAYAGRTLTLDSAGFDYGRVDGVYLILSRNMGGSAAGIQLANYNSSDGDPDTWNTSGSGGEHPFTVAFNNFAPDDVGKTTPLAGDDALRYRFRVEQVASDSGGTVFIGVPYVPSSNSAKYSCNFLNIASGGACPAEGRA